MKKQILISLIILLAACTPSGPKTFPSGCQIIDIPAALTNSIADIRQFIDSSWLVALTTPSQNLQGHITKAMLYKSKIYTLDELQSKTLNVYDSAGVFLYPLALLGKGPQEALNITNVSAYGDEIYATDILQNRTQVFSAKDGAFLHSLNYPFSAHELHRLADNKFLFVLSPYNDNAGEEYMKNLILITDSTFAPLHFFSPRPAVDAGPIERSQWNIADKNQFFSIFSECLYTYDPQTDSVSCRVGFDYGRDNVPDKACNNFRTYMNCFEDQGSLHLTSESPIVIGDYILGTVVQGDAKYFLIHDGSQSYTKKLSPDTYNIYEPLFPIGTGDNNLLISYIEVTIGLQQVIDNEIVVNGKKITEDNLSNILLFSKFKNK